ncbi:MAG: hypothetical protein LBU16_01985 [Treponema sp.]|jgi:hypothetical protein|nr:hypothetical protein [Treponema sp.]
MEINGAFIACMMIFVIPYIAAIIIFGKIKKYNTIKLFCGLTILWVLLSVIFVGIIYLITGGSINTKNGIKSSLDLSIAIGALIGWGIALMGGLLLIERVGKEGVRAVSSDIIKNGQSYWALRLLQSWTVLLVGSMLKIIYKWSKKQ